MKLDVRAIYLKSINSWVSRCFLRRCPKRKAPAGIFYQVSKTKTWEEETDQEIPKFCSHADVIYQVCKAHKWEEQTGKKIPMFWAHKGLRDNGKDVSRIIAIMCIFIKRIVSGFLRIKTKLRKRVAQTVMEQKRYLNENMFRQTIEVANIKITILPTEDKRRAGLLPMTTAKLFSPSLAESSISSTSGVMPTTATHKPIKTLTTTALTSIAVAPEAKKPT